MAVVLFCAGFAVSAQSPTLEAGDQTLRRVSHATRSELFGFVDLYRIGLYLPSGVSGIDALRNKTIAKGLRIEVLYDGSLPDNIPSGWKTELEPVLNPSQRQTLREAYAGLRPDDQIRIVYAPSMGTRLTVSGKVVLELPGHDLILAFLEIWLGQTPVSEDIKEELLKGW